jgi:hypothetical protein
MLGFMCGIVVGDWPTASGWIVRVQHLLGVAADSPNGWVAPTLGMFERRLEEAFEVASATQ